VDFDEPGYNFTDVWLRRRGLVGGEDDTRAEIRNDGLLVLNKLYMGSSVGGGIKTMESKW
jgi:hypothetical protein